MNISTAPELSAKDSASEKDSIRVVIRALNVLRAINKHHSLSMMEISKASGTAYATTYRIVETLIADGLIEREPDRKRYRPTEKTRELSYGFQQPDNILKRLLPTMKELTKEIGWPVVLTKRVGESMVIVGSTHSLTSLTFAVYYPGYSIPLFSCASGKAYMAFCPDEERETIVNILSEKDSANTDLTAPMLSKSRLNNLAKIREAGYATNQKNMHNAEPGMTSSIAFPIFGNGELNVCMSLVFFANAMKMHDALERYLPHLRQAQKDMINILDEC